MMKHGASAAWCKCKDAAVIGRMLTAVLSLVFLFSGLSKAISIEAMTHVVREYMAMLGYTALNTWATELTVGLCAAETVMGVAGLTRRFHAVAAIVMGVTIAYFTYVTYTNLTSSLGHVGSCGCFGEVISLSPEATFRKNILLSAVALAAVACEISAIRKKNKRQ